MQTAENYSYNLGVGNSRISEIFQAQLFYRTDLVRVSFPEKSLILMYAAVYSKLNMASCDYKKADCGQWRRDTAFREFSA